MLKNELLPIGSIITIGKDDVMIVGYVKKSALINNEQYDYVCCMYPGGMGENAILVKKEDIVIVKFIGFQDNRFVDFKHQFGKDNGK